MLCGHFDVYLSHPKPQQENIMIALTARPVVSTRECNLRDDSYFYATFFNGGTGINAFSEEMIGSTAFGGGVYDLPITASTEQRAQYDNEWLGLKSEFDRRNIICSGAKVYAPNGRKYRSMGIVQAITKDKYDSREWVALVEFSEGLTWIRTSKLVKFQEFIPAWE